MTILMILVVLLSTYIVGAFVSFIYHIGELTKGLDGNDMISVILLPFSFMMAVIMAVGWPIVVFDYIKDYFTKEKSNV